MTSNLLCGWLFVCLIVCVASKSLSEKLHHLNHVYSQEGKKSIQKRAASDCTGYSTCTSCEQSQLNCHWQTTTFSCRQRISQDGGQASCPSISHALSEILVHSGDGVDITVTTNNVEAYQRNNLRCSVQYLNSEVKSTLAQATGNTIKCDKMTLSYDDAYSPYIIAKLVVTWGPENYPFDSPQDINVRIYKCPQLVTNCGKCHNLDANYQCGWCDSRCSLQKDCAQNWLQRSDTCPNPKILRFSPATGPVGGKTNITVSGINLGNTFTDIDGGVSVGGTMCRVSPTHYESSAEFLCEIDVVDSKINGKVKVIVAQLYSTESDGIFSFVNPSLDAISPSVGPISGGTRVVISGSHMNTGTMTAVQLNSIDCQILRKNSTIIECLTSSSNTEGEASVTVNFGGVVKTLQQKFSYVGDPTILSVEPDISIYSGGTYLGIVGTDLNLVQNAFLIVYYNNKNITSRCEVDSPNAMICQTPSLARLGAVTSTSNPIQINFGFQLDGVNRYTLVSMGHLVSPITYHPDPQVSPFTVRMNYTGEKILIKGYFEVYKDLDASMTISVGSQLCYMPTVTMNGIECDPPSSPYTDDQGRAAVRFRLGNYEANVGYLVYDIRNSVESPLTLGIVLGVVLPIIALIILLTVCVIRHHRKHGPSERYFTDVLSDPPKDGKLHQDTGNHIGEDDTAYGTPLLAGIEDEALRLRIKELLIPRSLLEVGDLIRKGHFGVVYQAQYKVADDTKPINVAVKSLQGNTFDNKRIESLLRDGVMMKDFQHPNVLPILGMCVSSSDDVMVVMPHVQQENLKTYIQAPQHTLTLLQLMEYAHQVSEGMAYLAQLRFVHGDLAARNCLLKDSGAVCLSDAGINSVFTKDYYFNDDQSAKLPVKWMAPEVLESFVFTTSSDMWSFGVLVWELLTRGVTPYPNIEASDVKEYLEGGKQLKRPRNCPDFIYQIMEKCWARDPSKRATFQDVSEQIQNLITLTENGSNEAVSENLYDNVHVADSSEFLEVIG